MKKNHIGELFAAPVLMLSLAMPGFANTTSPAATPPAVSATTRPVHFTIPPRQTP